MGRLATTQSASTLLRQAFSAHETRMSAMIEIADRCNETCVHCYQVQGQKGELPTGDWKRILDELADMGVLFLTISGGEATLRKDFLELVAYARERRFAVKIFTNGLSMSESMARALADLAVQEVQISLYSHLAETHDWTTGVAGSFERTVRGIRYLTDAGLPVVVKTPLLSSEASEIREYIGFVESLGAHYAVDTNVSPRETGDRDPEGLAASPEQLIGLMRDPRFGASEPEEEERPLAKDDGWPCAPCGSIHIEANGEVRPCTALTVPLGNAVEGGVSAAYGSPEAKFLEKVRWRDIHGCRACDLRAYCSRCHSDAQFAGGDAFRPYEKACSRALVFYEAAQRRAPRVEGAPGRTVGPFRRTAKGCFEMFDDEFTEADVAMRQRHPWIVQEPQASPERVVQGELVQLRRPGQRKSIGQPVPGGNGGSTRERRE